MADQKPNPVRVDAQRRALRRELEAAAKRWVRYALIRAEQLEPDAVTELEADWVRIRMRALDELCAYVMLEQWETLP